MSVLWWVFVISRKLFLQEHTELVHCSLRANGLSSERFRHLAINCVPMINRDCCAAHEYTTRDSVSGGVAGFRYSGFNNSG